jgi:hypothetical protein
MGSVFQDLDRYYDPGLTLTVLGREYVLPLPSAELGLWCRRVVQIVGDVTAASSDEDMQAAARRTETLPELPGDLTLQERVLGPVYQQMIDDGVPDPYLQFAAETAYFWIAYGADVAKRYWESGGRPKPRGPAPYRADRRATQKTSTGEGSETKSQGSTSGTSSRPRSKRSGRRRGSGGRRS